VTSSASQPWWKRAGWAVFAIAVLYAIDLAAKIPVGQTDGSTRPVLNLYLYQIIASAAVNIILAVSLQLINGITGQFSIGHAGFMAIGGYAAADFSLHSGIDLAAICGGGALGESVSFVVALMIGAVFAAIAGLIVGIPSLRLRGDYLAIVTLGFGEIIRVIILNVDRVGAARGLSGIPQKTTIFTGYAFAAITVLVVWNIYHSSFGRAMLAVREDEIAAEAMGIRTTRTKVMAFVISSGFAGLAGGLFAHLFMYLHTNTFTFVKSIEIVMMIIIGGLGSITGAVFGGVVMTALPEVLRPVGQWRMVVYSLIIILAIRYRPQGLLGMRELPDILASLRRKKGGAR